MDRLEPLNESSGDRDAHTTPQLTHQVEQARAVRDLAHRQVRQGQVRQRDEDQAQPNTAEDQRPEVIRHSAVRREVPVLPHRQSEDRHARED